MAIQVDSVTKTYYRGKQSFEAVKNVSLQIHPGHFCCIMGRSGSGKTTLLNLISGLITPTSGSVFIDGENIAKFTDTQSSRYRNEKIGLIPQGQRVLSYLTVLDNVRLPAFFFRNNTDNEKEALALLEQVGIRHLAASYPKELSGGELKRIAIARALINKPDFLLADEPTADLDEETSHEVLKLLEKIVKQGTAVLMVTHDAVAASYADLQYQMKAGTLSLTMPTY
jgi:putative ABC transport system ATP-binding protein